jgi:uncharacterized membrane protein (DUF4010 family)
MPEPLAMTVITDLALAVGLGLMVGVQREWSASRMAGVRTFALVSLLGALCGLLQAAGDADWLVAGGLIAVTAMMWLGNEVEIAARHPSGGLTTEFAALVMYLVGVLVVREQQAAGVVIAGTVAVLLHWKEPLHRFVARIGAEDFRAVARLILVGMVILPVLPDRTYGPYDVLNPFRIWLMVVLIVGISLAAYVVRRLVGERAGSVAAGLLGGLISSTATTAAEARRARTRPEDAAPAAFVVMVASTVVFLRVLVEVAVVAPNLLPRVAGPLAAMMGVMLAVSTVAFLAMRRRLSMTSSPSPPSDMRAAVVFGLLYAGVLFAVAAVREQFGEQGLHVVAALSGLTDMDAITLSSAHLMQDGRLEPSTGWRIIMTAALSNLLLKLLLAATLGGRRIAVPVGLMFTVCMAAGGAIIAFWPD